MRKYTPRAAHVRQLPGVTGFSSLFMLRSHSPRCSSGRRCTHRCPQDLALRLRLWRPSPRPCSPCPLGPWRACNTLGLGGFSRFSWRREPHRPNFVPLIRASRNTSQTLTSRSSTIVPCCTGGSPTGSRHPRAPSCAQQLIAYLDCPLTSLNVSAPKGMSAATSSPAASDSVVPVVFARRLGYLQPHLHDRHLRAAAMKGNARVGFASLPEFVAFAWLRSIIKS